MKKLVMAVLVVLAMAATANAHVWYDTHSHRGDDQTSGDWNRGGTYNN